MDTLLIVLVVVIIVGLVALAFRRVRPTVRPAPGPGPWSDADSAGSRVVLDLEAKDPDHPSVQRLVQEAAARALTASPELDAVEVVDRTGTVLGVIRRTDPAARDLDVPAALHEPHLRRSRTPDPLAGDVRGGQPSGMPTMGRDDIDTSVPGRAFADRFDLPEVVRRHIDDPERPAAVVAALLRASGQEVERHGDLVVSGDDLAIVVTDVSGGAEDALTHAYLRIRDSRAAHGLVIRLGYADPTLIRRRDAATPNIRYASVDAIQRMADAVALGADPVAFAVGPPVAR